MYNPSSLLCTWYIWYIWYTPYHLVHLIHPIPLGSPDTPHTTWFTWYTKGSETCGVVHLRCMWRCTLNGEKCLFYAPLFQPQGTGCPRTTPAFFTRHFIIYTERKYNGKVVWTHRFTCNRIYSVNTKEDASEVLHRISPSVGAKKMHSVHYLRRGWFDAKQTTQNVSVCIEEKNELPAKLAKVQRCGGGEKRQEGNLDGFCTFKKHNQLEII